MDWYTVTSTITVKVPQSFQQKLLQQQGIPGRMHKAYTPTGQTSTVSSLVLHLCR